MILNNLQMIFAHDMLNGIGLSNRLPWSGNHKEDLIWFKKNTKGKTLLMGANTFKSLPSVLPERKHIVLSKTLLTSPHEDVKIVSSLSDLLGIVTDHPQEQFICIGGATLYDALYQHTKEFYVTKIVRFYISDTFLSDELMKHLHDNTIETYYEELGEALRFSIKSVS